MHKPGRTLKAIPVTITPLLGIIAIRPLIDPAVKVTLRVMDRRNANVWFIPKINDQFLNSIFVIRVPFENLDQAP